MPRHGLQPRGRGSNDDEDNGIESLKDPTLLSPEAHELEKLTGAAVEVDAPAEDEHASLEELAAASSDGDEESGSAGAEFPEGSREWRKAQRKAAKVQQRMRPEVPSGEDAGRKSCDLCLRRVDLLVRCTIDSSRKWRMVCGKCWKGVSGGVPDGDAAHPHYRYGGLWKNRRRVVT
jgi:hypothetical protein